MSSNEDSQIMQRVQEGDLSSLNLLFERYHDSLLGFFIRLSANRSLSEDLVQDTFCRILRYRDSFSPAKSFRAWMFQIGRNLYFDFAKKISHERAYFEGRLQSLPDLNDSEPRPDEEAEKAERIAILRSALDALPGDKREIIFLSRFEGLSQSEIADVLGCSVSAVKTRLFRAIKSLQESYLKLYGERAS